ncbi:hypothetical protein DSO57_1037029 [Entomophthora muscae]|uniref:Uncharacterized protein n=1 Tax=Entomophthora muscae TaxID=34485 RepID=A0ACC2U8Q7_9FUNG|nr:hypothetical protein DSO57_1037029 [Entomophthora muscae]
MSMSATKRPLDHTNKLFGIVYITLAGVIDTIILATVLWSWHQSSDGLFPLRLFPDNDRPVTKATSCALQLLVEFVS